MNYFKANIDKEEVNKLPVAEFNGKIYVIENPTDAERIVKKLLDEEIIGFDTETKPAFVKGKENKVALMQLSTEDECYLFRLNKMGLPSALARLMANENVAKIGLSLKDDFRMLQKLCGIKPANFVDLQNYVAQFGIEEKSLTKIFAIIFNQRISKNQRLTNWEAPVLTEKQQKYAALDAWATREIYIKLESLKRNY